MTDRELLTLLAQQFVLLHRLAASPGPILCDGKSMKKWAAVMNECDVARETILKHLENDD